MKPKGFGKQLPGFTGFRRVEDAEAYADAHSEAAQRAVRAIYDAGSAVYVTEAAWFDLERFDGKPYARIDSDDFPYPLYISAKVVERVRWRYMEESEYTASDYMCAAYTAWGFDDVSRSERFFRGAAEAVDATPAQRSESMLLRAIMLQKLGRDDDALELLETVDSAFSAEGDSRTRAFVCEALVDKGNLLARMGRREEALLAFDAAIRRYGQDREERVLEEVARGMLHAGVQLCELGRFEEAVRVNSDLVTRFSVSTEPRVIENVTLGFRNKAAALQRLKRVDEAIDACDALVVAGLERLGRREDAATCCREIIARFEASSDEELRQNVARARGAESFELASLSN